MNLELHIVVGKDGFIREQDGRQSFASVVADIISGQYDEDATQILRIVPPLKGWPHSQVVEDVTSKVAHEIYDMCEARDKYILYNSPAYQMVEQHVGIASARKCLDRDAEAA